MTGNRVDPSTEDAQMDPAKEVESERSDAGRKDAALAAVKAEVARLRALWRERPDLFSPALVAVLRDVGQALQQAVAATHVVSRADVDEAQSLIAVAGTAARAREPQGLQASYSDRKSTRLNSSH